MAAYPCLSGVRYEIIKGSFEAPYRRPSAWAHGIAAPDTRHDRCVDHRQPLDAAYTQPGPDAKGDMIPKRSTHYFLTNRADR